MAKNIILGIDIGGSTTKIVGFDKSVREGDSYRLIKPLFIRAQDPLTSLYGAFGKFLDMNGLYLSDIEKIMVTGAGSSFLTRPIYNLPCEIIAEFRCIGLGGLYLTGLDQAVVASCGTGTALVFAKHGEEPVYLGGTGVGGGTLVGLSKKLFGMDNVDHVSEIAKNGDLKRVDLKISDITNHEVRPGFDDLMTASNFGRVSDLATNSDIALGLINMVFETIAMVAFFAAKNYDTKDIVLTGNLSGVYQAPEIFGSLSEMFGVNFIIPESSRFGTVIGAALSGCDTTL